MRGVGGGVVRRRHFHQVAANDVQARQPPQHGLGLAHRHAANLGRAGAGRESGIQAIDVERHIHGRVADDGSRLGDDGVHPKPRNVLRMDHGHAGFIRELPQVFGRSTDADLDRARRVEHAFQHRLAEWPAVMEAAAVEGAAGVAMRIEMHQRHGLPGAQRPQDGQCHGMVAAHRERRDAGCHEFLVGRVDVLVRLFQAVAAAHRHVADVGHAQLAHRRALERMVVGADPLDGAQRARPEATAAAVAGAQIHRHAEQRHLQVAEIRLGPVDLPRRRVEQCRHAGIGRAAGAAVVDDVGRHRAKVRIVDDGFVGAAEPGAQRGQLLGGETHGVLLEDESP